MAAGIKLPAFNEAWEEYIQKTRKTPRPTTLYLRIYMVVLGFIMLTGLDTAYWRIVIRTENEVFAANYGKVAIVASLILIMHIASRFAGSSASVITTTKTSVFILAVTYLAHIAANISATEAYIIILFGGVLLGFVVFFTILEVYDISIIGTFIFALISAILISVIVYLTMGFSDFKSYFTPKENQDVKILNDIKG